MSHLEKAGDKRTLVQQAGRIKRAKRIAGNLLLLAVSVCVSLLVAELLARIVFDPVDFLLPQVVPDPFLSYRIQAYSGGHDAWGFRNHAVPQSADIVCIGDSMTYGEQARADESWPAVLGKLSGKTVYNMSIGGYGPTQYLYLMRTKAPTLHPKIVIIGYFFGNDLMDVYNEVHFNKNWSAYGQLGRPDEKAPAILAIQPPPGRFLEGVRRWLSSHSVFFALLTRTSAFDFFRQRELRTAMAGDPGEYFPYQDPKHYVFFNLRGAALYDLRDSRIESAMEVTKKIMLDMRDTAEANAFRLVVALIPTKERVYANLLTRAGYIEKYPRLQEAINQEDMARDVLSAFLHQNKIETVDLLPALQAAVDGRDLYPLNNMHPNEDGYHVIAEAIYQYLDGLH